MGTHGNGQFASIVRALRTGKRGLLLAVASAPIALWVPAALAQRAEPAPQSNPKLIDLRPRFEKDQEIRYEMGTETTTAFDAGGDSGLDLSGTQKIQQKMELLFKVRETNPETGTKLEIIVERVTARLVSDDSDVSFDSRKPATGSQPGQGEAPEAAALEALGKIAGSSVLLTIDPSGNISSISAPTSVPGADAFDAIANPAIGGLLSVNGGIGLPFGELLSVGHPTGLVKPREEWTNKDRLGGVGMTMITTHKLRTASGNAARVEISGKIERPSEGGAPGADPEASAASMIKGFEFSGDYNWDTGKGQLNTLDVRSEFSMERGPLKYQTRMVCSVRRVR